MLPLNRLLLLPGLLLTATVWAADMTPDGTLEGRWLLDTERSDDAAARLDDALDDIASDLRARPSRSPVQVRRTSRSELGDELLAPLTLPRHDLSLAVGTDRVRFAIDGGQDEVLFTDGRPSVADADNRGVHFAAWENGVLWVERSSDRGTRVVSSWRRTANDLIAAYEIRNGLFDEHVTFTLVFVPAATESAHDLR
ncbi:MAG TPA: hypothetical protein VLA56_09285 [Pseudomonadales bacterium]|nr:hypothetical protein [Pseudomonadales bacterium]